MNCWDDIASIQEFWRNLKDEIAEPLALVLPFINSHCSKSLVGCQQKAWYIGKHSGLVIWRPALRFCVEPFHNQLGSAAKPLDLRVLVRMCLLWSLHRGLWWSSVSWLDPVKLGSLYMCRYSVDRIVINLLVLCFCEWYIAETRFCWIPPKCAGFVAVWVLVSAGWTLQRAATPASGPVLSLSLELGLLGACPEHASSGGQPEVWAKFRYRIWGSP